MNKNKKVLLVVLLGITIADGAYLSSAYEAMFSEEGLKNNILIQREAEKAEAIVQSSAGDYITAQIFEAGVSEDTDNFFEKFFKNIQSDVTFRVKVWNKDLVIIWSDLKDLIGKTFKDNEEASEAFLGDMVFEIKLPEKQRPEQMEASAYNNFIEVYVPIKNEKGEVFGLIEVYQSTENIISDLNRDFWMKVLYNAAVVLILFSVVLVL